MENKQNIILTSRTVTAVTQTSSEDFFCNNERKSFQEAKRSLNKKRTQLNIHVTSFALKA
ncbi:hypothetical protein AB6D08_20635 [Vibrio splendidus]